MSDNDESSNAVNSDFDSWLDKLRSGDAQAMQELFDQHFSVISKYADRRLSRTARRVEAGEDVALSAINSFVRGVQENRFDKLRDDQELLKLLYVITSRKSNRYNERHHAAKRGGGMVRGESLFIQGDDGSRGQSLADMAASEHSSGDDFDNDVEDLIGRLDDETLVQIAILKLQGLSNTEIAQEMKCVERTVRRKLQLIYEVWMSEPESE